MSKNSAIGWTDHTFNPWWGCFKVSDGCKNCYAEAFSKRTGHAIWGPPATTERRTFGPKHWAEPLAWNAEAERDGVRRRVFCASMADVFEDHPQLGPEREKLWSLISRTPYLDWLLLTKRPENVARMVPDVYNWPRNVWLGTSVEHQSAADERIPMLLQYPAAIRFLSCEPLLGAVDLLPWLPTFPDGSIIHRPTIWGSGLDWVIAGGESGPNRRPMHMGWARSLRDQCQAAGIPFFFKQSSDLYPGRGTVLDGREWHEWPESPSRVGQEVLL